MSARIAQAALDEHKLSIRTVFVPWSKSRDFAPNKRPNQRSLNWKVTLLVGEREIMTVDYTSGIGHCPSYKAHGNTGQGRSWSLNFSAIIEKETEEGFDYSKTWERMWASKGKPIVPNPLDVWSSVILDAKALDYGCFEDWAMDHGFDLDSRKAEAIYRACLADALKLRAMLGDVTIIALRAAFQDY